MAIVLAVGGTWLNLNKLGEVKAVTLHGYAVAGGIVDVVEYEIIPPWNEVDEIAAEDGSVVVDPDEDCYVASWNETTGLADTTPCSLSSSSNITNITLQVGSNAHYNISSYWTKTIATNFGAGSLNHQYVGYCWNETGSLGESGTNLALDTYITADSNTSVAMVPLFVNVTNIPSRQNYTFNWAKTFDLLTATGSYSNTLNIVIHTDG
ncbi:MAG: hypothetical protein KAT77_03940 [Nanoarchaeota archaeon]|nr:hypothetical protein [Nanoarchaeota archaeon]